MHTNASVTSPREKCVSHMLITELKFMHIC